MTSSVLHLAPHFGGGVGAVVRSLLISQQDSKFVHRLLALESMNKAMCDWCQQNGIQFLSDVRGNRKLLNQWIESADIVHIHWWNHPLLMEWMVDNQKPAFRSVLWAHVNGMHAPQNFFQELINYPDFFVCASEYSFQSPYLLNQNRKIRVIQSQSRIKITEPKLRGSREQFKIGYIGTVDKIKMHPNFIDLCVNAKIENAKFIVCGGPHHDKLKLQVDKLGVASLFEIRGVVSDVDSILADLDVFGYPLSSEHYGTGEQVLLEAMGAGVVPVVLDTGCEKYIIEHGKNGIITSTVDDYSAALNYLRFHPHELQRLSNYAVDSIRKRLNKQQYSEDWQIFYEELLEIEKHDHQLNLPADLEGFSNGAKALLFSYGKESVRKDLENILENEDKKPEIQVPVGIWSSTRGSPFHYMKFFPHDDALKKICERLEWIREELVEQ